MILENQKDLFDIPAGITYLNCAYMSPVLKKVNVSGMKGMNKRSQPWEIHVEDWFQPAEELRSLFAKIVNADKECIAFVPSASYGLAVAANNISLTAKQKIIVLDGQYPSNYYVWKDLSERTGAALITIKRAATQTWTDAILEKIDNNTGLVAIPNCHWTDGSLVDLEKVSHEAKKVNAKLIIDASQSLGAYPLDLNKIKPDFLCTVGYKWLLGSYGLSYLYADPSYCETGVPIEFGWLNRHGSEDFTRLVDYTDEYRTGARRFDAGGFPGFINIPMATAALTQILDWGIDNIQQSLSILTDEIELRAKEMKLETSNRMDRVGHLIGVKCSGAQVASISKKLSSNKIYISFRGTNMRIAPHLYNNKNDIERFFLSL